jgi:hypothetical protein
MINSKVDHCKTLEEFYSEICRQQEEAHGAYYLAQHDAIRKYLKIGNCEYYKELGTHQGGTAAAACLEKPVSVELVDISLEKFSKSKHLFEYFCKENNVKLKTREMNSSDPKTTSRCDLLLIDTYHHPSLLIQELKLHSPYVIKYIILHDTSIINSKANDALYQTAVNFTAGITPWKIIERNTQNVGYTVLANTINVPV